MLRELKEERIDFGRFVVETRREYRAMATYLFRRWNPPDWFTLEDAEQEMYLDTWRKFYGGEDDEHPFPRYNENGVSLVRWVVYGAMSIAKREVHRARKAKLSGSADRNPSRFELSISSVFGDDAGALVDMILAQPPAAERELSAEEERRSSVLEHLRACQNAKEKLSILAIREAKSLDGASRVLYDDDALRIRLRLGSEEIAERFVAKHAARVARRMAARVNPG
jgi:hypothetical protein